jgi:ATP-dependent DNA ligase
VLRRIFEDINATPIGLSENIEAPPTDMIRVAKEFGFESIVAKRKDSLYESGKRTGAWAKYKVNRGPGVCGSAASFQAVSLMR